MPALADDLRQLIDRDHQTARPLLHDLVAPLFRLGVEAKLEAARGFLVRPEVKSLPHFGLTLRETEIAGRIAAGRSNKEIGSALGIEERTVKAHVAKLMRKVGVQNRIALSVHAITHSLVTAK